MTNFFCYEYDFPTYKVVRTVKFDGVRWCLTVCIFNLVGCLIDRFDSQHFTKETLSREFFEKFPECRSFKLQSVKKIFTNS